MDFGISTMLEEGENELKTNAGTKMFLAPETWSFNKKFDGYKVDVWAAGVTLYYMIFGKLPFTGKNVV